MLDVHVVGSQIEHFPLLLLRWCHVDIVLKIVDLLADLPVVAPLGLDFFKIAQVGSEGNER